MSAPDTVYTTNWFSKISELDRQAWDRLALPLPAPFLEWEWLFQLEASGSVGADKGWQPAYLTVWKGARPGQRQSGTAGQLVAAAPLYIKTHSEGEFVYDYLLADLAQQLQLPYYPKLVGMSPFTPVPAYRFLIDPAEDSRVLSAIILQEIDRFCECHKIHSCQFNYTAPDWDLPALDQRFFKWTHPCFDWYNPGLTSFDDYLKLFNKNQRRNIKREREKIVQAGLTIRSFTGNGIPDYLLARMYEFYARTNEQHGPWGCQYLTAAFFTGLQANYKSRLLLLAAFPGEPAQTAAGVTGQAAPVQAAEPVGMSFLLVKNDRLYGRYWGSQTYIDALHFNLCFYSPIEWALAHQVKYFDPGIGSNHKSRRGFIAVPNYSFHRYYQPAFARIMGGLFAQINDWEKEQLEAQNSCLPFQRADISGELN